MLPSFMQFEVPDMCYDEIIDKVWELDHYEHVNCFYIPPVIDDYETNVRDMYSQKRWINEVTREKYAAHIKKILDRKPGAVQLLLQHLEGTIERDKLQWYIDLGFTKFCVGNYDQAKMIKDINKNFEVTGSITMRLDKEKLEAHPEYKDVFDQIVLHFNYCKDLPLVKDMPKDYRYLVLCNASCSTECPGSQHWRLTYKRLQDMNLKQIEDEYKVFKEDYCRNFHSDNPNNDEAKIEEEFYRCCSKEERLNMQPPLDLCPPNRDQHSCYMPPWQAIAFYPYISVFKMVDREMPWEEICRIYEEYVVQPNFHEQSCSIIKDGLLLAYDDPQNPLNPHNWRDIDNPGAGLKEMGCDAPGCWGPMGPPPGMEDNAHRPDVRVMLRVDTQGRLVDCQNRPLKDEDGYYVDMKGRPIK